MGPPFVLLLGNRALKSAIQYRYGCILEIPPTTAAGSLSSGRGRPKVSEISVEIRASSVRRRGRESHFRSANRGRAGGVSTAVIVADRRNVVKRMRLDADTFTAAERQVAR